MGQILTRRNFVGGLVAAPAVVCAANIMPVRLWNPKAWGQYVGVVWADNRIVWMSPIMDRPILPKAIIVRSQMMVREMMVPDAFPGFRVHRMTAGLRAIRDDGSVDFAPSVEDVPFG